MKVLLASGLAVEAGDLFNGAKVIGVDGEMKPAVGTVSGLQTLWKERWGIELEDGRCVEFSKKHRVAVLDRGWVEVQNLRPGDVLISRRESIVSKVVNKGMGQVVSFSVEGCNTYFSEDILSHNRKITID